MRLRNYLIERNVANVKQIEDYIDTFLRLTQVEPQQVKKWFRTTFRKWVINDYNFVEKLKYFKDKDQFGFNKGGYGKDEKWIKAALRKGEDVYDVEIDSQHFRGILIHLLDFFLSDPNLRIQRMSVPEAQRQADRWVQEMNKRASDVEDKDGIKEIMKIKSYKWVKVFSKQCLDREGKLMKHCVGSYYDRVISDRSIIYSLRDSKNIPHVTIEVDSNGNIEQIQGKSNTVPKKEYIPYIIEFIKKQKFKLYRPDEFLELVGLYYTGTEFVNIDNWPDNVVIKHDVDFRGMSITSLPKKGLIVLGELDIGHTYITELPETLICDHLLIDGCNIKKYPTNHLEIKRGSLSIVNKVNLAKTIKITKGELELDYSTIITSVSKKMYVGSNLALHGSKIDKLPDDLHVGGDLSMTGSGILHLPKKLRVDGDLYMNDTSIKTIPSIAIVKGNIIVDEDQLKDMKIPKKFKRKIITV